MTKFTLHGGVTSRSCVNNDKYYKKIIGSSEESVKILLVYFAKPKEAWPEIFEDHKKIFMEKSGGKKIELTIASVDTQEFKNQIRINDIIYIRGGSTPMLQAYLEKATNLEKLLKNKIVAGLSAGALVFAKYYYDQDYGRIFKGLGILNVKIITHYLSTGKYAATSGKEKLKALEKYRENLPVYAIPETEHIIVNKKS